MVNLYKLSENLKELMSERNLNQTALAEAMGTCSSKMSSYVTGKRAPNYDTFIALINFFNCSADYLLGLTDDYSGTQFKQRPPFSQQLTIILQHFNVTKYRMEKDTGIAEKTVNRWHNGKTQPTCESLIKLAKYFDCSVDFILGRV